MTERLMKTGVRTPLQWFYFGAALHYLADSFTFCAQPHFYRQHNRTSPIREGAAHVFPYLQTHRDSIFTAEEVCHESYLLDRRSYQTDCRYILGATVMLCSRLDIRWCANKIGERNYA